MPVRALRGATTVDEDTREAIHDRVRELLEEIFRRNEVRTSDLISVVFTATDDLHSCFPAEVARKCGLADVPLLCARELDVDGAVPRCIRVLIHLETETPREMLQHVYLHGAQQLRDDLGE